MSDDSPVTVEFTPGFKRNLRRLARKYRSIRSDLSPLIDEIVTGLLPGRRIPRSKYHILKARVASSDLQRGKSGGYRVIYLVEADRRVLITVYAKTEQGDVSEDDLRRIIAETETR